MSHRRRSGLRHDGGTSAVEYGAVLVLVAALAAVFTVVALPERVKTSTAAAICQLFSGNDARDCPDDQQPPAADDDPNTGNDPAGDEPALPDPAPQGQPPATDPAADPAGPALDPNDPDVQAYNNAKKQADAADQGLKDLDGLSEQAKQEIIDFLKDLVGVTDIQNCLTKGDIAACLSSLTDFVPAGRILKLLKKIPGAIKLAKKLKNLWDKAAEAKARKKKADDALADAEKKLKDKGVCKLPSSFLPGTRILLADGTSTPIENIQVGDLVQAADPATGESGPRPVTHLITSYGTKRLVTLSTGPFGRLGPALTATANHPFWNPGARAWRNAADLAPGTSLRTPSGQAALTSARSRTAVARVHNLTVAGLHTYYAFAGDTPVLVHNAGGCWRDRFDSLPDGRQAGSVKIVKDAKELRSLFDNLAEGAERLPARGPKIPEVYKLEDGTVVQWRTASQSGGETIDIFPPGGKPLKVHIDGGN